MSHDASATWSGFNYQGKVALYHTLKLIIDELLLNVNFDFSDYQLILENNEDFDIRGPDGFISFHQVKAINETAFSTYENALFAMILQLLSPDYSNVTGYIHTWRNLNWNNNASFEEKLKEIINKIITEHNLTPIESRLTKGFQANNINDKKIKILKQVILSDARFTDADSAFFILNEAFLDTDDSRVINRVKQYSYGDNKFCSIEDIDLKVKNLIFSLYRIVNNEDISDLEQNKIFCTLLRILDENVINKHLNLNRNQLTPLSFNMIKDTICNINARDSDELFLASKFKHIFVRTFEEFIDDDELCPVEISKSYYENDSNLNLIMGVLLNLPSAELWKYFKKLNPHISYDTDCTMNMALETSVNDLRRYLFLIFSSICKTKLNHSSKDFSIFYINGKHKYLPTTIGDQSKKRLVLDIMHNSHAISSLYEVTAMITGFRYASEIASFSLEYSNLSSVSLDSYYINEAPEKKEKINQISQDIRLITINTAMEEISNA